MKETRMKIVVDKMPTKPSECFYAHDRRINEVSGHEYGICWIRGDGDWSSEVCALSYDKPCSYLTEAKEKPMPEQLRRLLLDPLRSTPTDAVPVIRCKDCKWYGRDKLKGGFCRKPEASMWSPGLPIDELKPDDYCSRAKRKEDINGN